MSTTSSRSELSASRYSPSVSPSPAPSRGSSYVTFRARRPAPALRSHGAGSSSDSLDLGLEGDALYATAVASPTWRAEAHDYQEMIANHDIEVVPSPTDTPEGIEANREQAKGSGGANGCCCCGGGSGGKRCLSWSTIVGSKPVMVLGAILLLAAFPAIGLVLMAVPPLFRRAVAGYKARAHTADRVFLARAAEMGRAASPPPKNGPFPWVLYGYLSVFTLTSWGGLASTVGMLFGWAGSGLDPAERVAGAVSYLVAALLLAAHLVVQVKIANKAAKHNVGGTASLRTLGMSPIRGTATRHNTGGRSEYSSAAASPTPAASRNRLTKKRRFSLGAVVFQALSPTKGGAAATPPPAVADTADVCLSGLDDRDTESNPSLDDFLLDLIEKRTASTGRDAGLTTAAVVLALLQGLAATAYRGVAGGSAVSSINVMFGSRTDLAMAAGAGVGLFGVTLIVALLLKRAYVGLARVHAAFAFLHDASTTATPLSIRGRPWIFLVDSDYTLHAWKTVRAAIHRRSRRVCREAGPAVGLASLAAAVLTLTVVVRLVKLERQDFSDMPGIVTLFNAWLFVVLLLVVAKGIAVSKFTSRNAQFLSNARYLYLEDNAMTAAKTHSFLRALDMLADGIAAERPPQILGISLDVALRNRIVASMTTAMAGGFVRLLGL